MVGVFAYSFGKEKNWVKRLIITSAVFAFVPILNSSFSAFNDAYYARWFYMPILIMCLATSMAIEDEKADWDKGFKYTSIITLVITLVVGLFPETKKDENGITKIVRYGLYSTSDHEETKKMYIFRYWFTCLIALAGLLVLYFLLKLKKKHLTKFLKVSIACVAIISVLYANFFIKSGKSHSYETDVMIDDLIENEINLPGDKDTYRIDVYSGIDNTGMFLNYSTINCFHSIVPPKVTEFYEFIGEQRGVASRPTTDSYAARPLLSVKYLLARTGGESFESDNTTRMPNYTKLEEVKGYTVYENENYIGYGFSYDKYMTYQFCEGYNENNRAKLMLKAILLSPEQIDKYGYMFDNNLEDENYYLDLSDEQMAEDAKDRNATSAISFDIGKNSFKATVQRDSDDLVFFSIPYDEGWSAYVNGQKVEVENVNIAFMAVKVGAGVSEIEFRYQTPGLNAGITISLIALFVLMAYVYLYGYLAKKYGESYCYPEGNNLLAEWKKAEENEEIQETLYAIEKAKVYEELELTEDTFEEDTEE